MRVCCRSVPTKEGEGGKRQQFGVGRSQQVIEAKKIIWGRRSGSKPLCMAKRRRRLGEAEIAEAAAASWMRQDRLRQSRS
jgi:hypothetical protein